MKARIELPEEPLRKIMGTQMNLSGWRPDCLQLGGSVRINLSLGHDRELRFVGQLYPSNKKL